MNCPINIKHKAISTKQQLIYLLGLFVFLFVNPTLALAAPHLSLDPSSGTISTSGTSVTVKIDTSGQAAKSAKAVITFDTAKFEISSVTAGSFFDEVSHNIYNSSGQVVINANLSLGSSLETKTGTGTLATLLVKAKASSGTGDLTFSCTAGSSTDSGINDATPTDIIDCTANINGSYSLGAATGGTTSPSPSSTTKASSLPVAGSTGPTTVLLAIGLALILLPLPLLFLANNNS